MYNIYGDGEKLNVSEIYTDKTACDQFLWQDQAMKGGRLVRDQDTFKKKFFKRFQDMKEAEIYKNFTHLQHEGTMDDYFRNLLVFVTSVQDINEE